MTIPSEINALIEQLNQQLNQIEQEATEGLVLARAIIQRFPNNDALTQMLAFLNSARFYADSERSRIQTIVETLSQSNQTTGEEIQEAGEDLSAKLGRVLETKMRVIRAKNRLENLQ